MPNKQNELLQLQDEITREVTKDAPHIATMVFGDNANHPDMAQVSNQQLDDVYRQKFQAEDRTWLQAEARRDPEQFLKVSERIGARVPPPPMTAPPPMPAPAPAMPAALPPPPVPAALTPPPPPAMPVPATPIAMPPGMGPPPAQPPVLLGPNGQPIAMA